MFDPVVLRPIICGLVLLAVSLWAYEKARTPIEKLGLFLLFLAAFGCFYYAYVEYVGVDTAIEQIGKDNDKGNRSETRR